MVRQFAANVERACPILLLFLSRMVKVVISFRYNVLQVIAAYEGSLVICR